MGPAASSLAAALGLAMNLLGSGGEKLNEGFVFEVGVLMFIPEAILKFAFW